MTYERTPDGAIRREVDIEGVEQKLILRAQNVRKERTGVHATITIGFGSTILDEDTFNIGRREDRNRLSNAAVKNPMLDRRVAEKMKSVIEHELLLFLRDLWDAWVDTGNYSGWVMGDEEPSAPKWSVPGLIIEGSTGIHVGDAKSGKSTFERIVAQSLEYDVATLFPAIKPGHVVWVNAEEPDSEHKRQFGNVNQALGLPRISPVYTVEARGLTIQDVATKVKVAVEKHEAQHVFVDSLSRLAQGMSLNNNDTATTLIDALAGLPTSVTWIGHTGWGNRHRLAGSKHFLNAARLMVRIQGRIRHYGMSPELTRGLRVQVTEGNGVAPVDTQFFTLRYHRDYGLEQIERASEDEWPVLRCDADVPSGKSLKQCGALTWDGVIRGVGIRCDKHLREDGDDS